MLAAALSGVAELCSAEPPQNQAEKALPYPILAAIGRAMFVKAHGLRNLLLPERVMLAHVIRCLDKDRPTELAFVRRTTLADQLECSKATVTRQLARLEEAGWIVRDQVKSRIRGFQVGGIALTHAAAAALFTRPSTDPQAQRRAPVTHPCRTSVKEEKQSSQRQLASTSGHVENFDTKTRSKRGGVNLPVTLRWLVDHMSPFGVCKLMAIARDKQIRLEDVTNQCMDQIRTAKRPFGYVRSLLRRDKDWKLLARQRADQAAAQEKVKADKAAVSQAGRDLSGQCFFDEDKGLACRIEGSFVLWFRSEVCEAPKGDSFCSRPLDADFLDAIEAGRLKRIEVAPRASRDERLGTMPDKPRRMTATTQPAAYGSSEVGAEEVGSALQRLKDMAAAMKAALKGSGRRAADPVEVRHPIKSMT